jgi:hypothetical protein
MMLPISVTRPVISSSVLRRRAAGLVSRVSARALRPWGLFHPARDEHRVGPGFKGGAVLAQPGVTVGDLLLCALVWLRLTRPGGFVGAHGRGERDRAELAGQPRIELREQQFLAQVTDTG